MSLISNGFSLESGKITKMSLDVGFERYLVRDAQYEMDNNTGSQYLVHSLSRSRFKNITRGGVEDSTYMWFENNLVLIMENSISKETGKKVVESYLAEVDPNTGNIFRVPYLLLQFESSYVELLYGESIGTYINVLRHLKEHRTEDVRDLFVRINGEYTKFLDVVDDIIDFCEGKK